MNRPLTYSTKVGHGMRLVFFGSNAYGPCVQIEDASKPQRFVALHVESAQWLRDELDAYLERVQKVEGA